MVNPGSFKGLRREFLDAQKEAYAAAVAGNHVADTVSDIQRRYFKRFPITLPHSQEPTAEFLATVNDDSADPELAPPSGNHPDPEERARAQRLYDLQITEMTMRKAQIKRRLQYVYNKSKGQKTTYEIGTNDPMAILMTKLTGNTIQRPRMKTAYNLWGPENRSSVDPVFAERVKGGGIPAKHHAALRSAIYKELFDKLPAEERRSWVKRAETEQQVALAKVESTLKAGPSTAPEDRQRVIECLPQFVEPILDLIAEHTGWKVSLIAGGPEPADGGRLNMVSVHSGTTSGTVKMNFGRSERVAYRDYIVPTFGKFLKKCFTVQECRERALPESSEFAGLAAAEENHSSEVHTFDDGHLREDEVLIKVSAPSLKTSATRTASGNSTQSASVKATSVHPATAVKIGPPHGKKQTAEDAAASSRAISTAPVLGSGIPTSPISTADAASLPTASNTGAADTAPVLVSGHPTSQISAPPIPTSTNADTPTVNDVASDSTADVAPGLASRGPTPPISRPQSPISPGLFTTATPSTASPNISAPVIVAPTALAIPSSTTPPQVASRGRSASVIGLISHCTIAIPLRSVSAPIGLEKPTASTQATSLLEKPAPQPTDAPSRASEDTPVQASAGALSDSSNQRMSKRLSVQATPPPHLSHTPLPKSALPSPRETSTSILNAASPVTTHRSAPGAAMAPTILAISEEEQQSRKRKGNADTNGASPKKAKTDTSTDASRVQDSPAWAANALELFASTDLGPEWKKLINIWVELERRSDFQGKSKIGARGRPKAVGEWIQRARSPKFRPDIKNIDSFATDFISWWRTLQPDWRADAASSNLRRDQGNWDVLRQPGVNGLVSIIAALFFWGNAVHESAAPTWDTWNNALDDVLFAVSQLL